MFKAWLTSCVSCLWPQADQESKRPHARQHPGVEREMQVCHSQPHLVPPMKLVFYGDLPSPGGTSPSMSSPSLPPWVHETRSLASRASQRASVLLTRKKTQTRPIISAPTDFRRVDPPPLPRRRTSFRPLELSIYLPGNRLSNLPEFSHFDLDSPDAPSPLPKALMSPFNSAGHLRRDSGPFKLARKPVGSAPSRRNSLATIESQVHQAQAQARQSLDTILLSPLVPHFSVLSPTDKSSAHQYVRSPSESERLVEPARGQPAQNNILPAETGSMVDTPFPPKVATLVMDRKSLDRQRGSTNTIGKKQPNQTQPLSSLHHNTATSHPIVYHQSTKSSSTFQTHSRARTTSNSTASSSTPSLSSAITAATTILPSDKEIEGAYTALPMIPASVKNSVVVEEPQVHDEQELVSEGYEYDQRFPLSPIGVAF